MGSHAAEFSAAVTDAEAENIDLLSSDVNGTNKFGWTLLHRAVMTGREDVVEALLANPEFVAVNSRIPGGETALHLAAQTGQMRAVKALLAHPSTAVNALSESRRRGGWRACELAARAGHEDIEATIRSHPRVLALSRLLPPPVVSVKGQKKNARKALQEQSTKSTKSIAAYLTYPRHPDMRNNILPEWPLVDGANVVATSECEGRANRAILEENMAVAAAHSCFELQATSNTGDVRGTDQVGSWGDDVNLAPHVRYEPLSAPVREKKPAPEDLMYDNSSLFCYFPSVVGVCVEPSELMGFSSSAADVLQDLQLEADKVDKQQPCFADDKLPTRRKLKNVFLKKQSDSCTGRKGQMSFNKIPA
eukprot:TRINITY_DN75841_c0_g1_i1.p1 TRINITY_DN75841_c0_g1~~TRINITY_DN75841_c0_g1_i1.p1  ORF type:complete len:363 (+),score=63.03 TRINITY_DN75841_c0_g1_i1:39-1127(+)